MCRMPSVAAVASKSVGKPRLLQEKRFVNSKPLSVWTHSTLIPRRAYPVSYTHQMCIRDRVKVKSIAHITGGGFYENIPRALPQDKKAVIDRSALEIPPIFSLIQQVGGIPERDMFNTYNMGTGMCLVVAKEDADRAVRVLNENGESAKVVGEIRDGGNEVEIC